MFTMNHTAGVAPTTMPIVAGRDDRFPVASARDPRRARRTPPSPCGPSRRDRISRRLLRPTRRHYSLPVSGRTTSALSQRARGLAAASGVLYVVFLVLGEALPREVGIRFELVGHVLLLFFIGYLTTILSSERSVEWLARTALGAAAAATAVKLVSAAPFLVAYREPPGSEAARTLEPMSDALFIFTMIPLAAMTAAIGLAVIWTRTLSLWVGLSAALLSVALLVNGMFVDAAFGAAFILFLIWTVAVSVSLFVRRNPPLRRHA